MTSPVPPINPGNRDYRIGDAERQEAMDALGKHFTAGRLDVTEYDLALLHISETTRHEAIPYAAFCLNKLIPALLPIPPRRQS